ncbi:MAG TPA: PEGA domain-containing protein, partial [Candidatus Portnoybacteria bacterium]|nr:PEGA domain-containing protein [Candidatus Portnoybacteria bacterium]
MIIKTRRITFYFFLGCFLIITPITILYASGWRVDWQKKTLAQTGAIFLRSQPKKAEIFINHKLVKQTPANIKGLIPDYYQILIKKEGFHLWQKRLKVNPALVTEVQNILLVAQKPELVQLAEGIKDFILSPNGKRLAYLTTGPEGGIWLINLNDKSRTQIVSNKSLGLPADQVYQDWQWT